MSAGAAVNGVLGGPVPLRSDTIASLAGALAKAQGKIEEAEKGSVNPHFKSRYADLASVWSACRAALTGSGLCVVQTFRPDSDGATVLRSDLLHESGEWVASELRIPQLDDPQRLGSWLTYARRYALSALVGVAPGGDDDDAEAATSGAEQPTEARQYAIGGLFRFGLKKGKPYAEGTVRDLEWYAGALRTSLADPEKAQYKVQNEKDLAAVEAELERREADILSGRRDPEPERKPQVRAVTKAEVARIEKGCLEFGERLGLEPEVIGAAMLELLQHYVVAGGDVKATALAELRVGDAAHFLWRVRAALRGLVPPAEEA